MISEEKLREAVNLHLAELLAEELTTKILAGIDGQWRQVVQELASTRRANEKLKESLATLSEYCGRLEKVVSDAERNQRDVSTANKHASILLSNVLKEMGFSEDE